MIIEIRVENCYVFASQIAFSLMADMRSRRFAANVCSVNGFNVLKSSGIYGPNNAGKTCLVKCIRAVQNVILNRENVISPNIFSHNPVCALGVTFLDGGRVFAYDFRYDVTQKEFIYEAFTETSRDHYGNEKTKTLFLRDTINNEFRCADPNLQKMMGVVSRGNIMIHLVDAEQFADLGAIKRVLTDFAGKIDIVNMNNIPLAHTIEIMKNPNGLQKRVVEFIKNADLYLDDFEYTALDKIQFVDNLSHILPEEKVLSLPSEMVDQARLASTYRGVKVPSLLFDSTGTKKIAALASYVIEALAQGRILVVDELDNGLHFRLTRAIVSLFNNELNATAQMIFTVHDVSLMDCRRLFRKEQVWFVDKDKDGVYVYSLADFTAEEGFRDTSDMVEKYRRGAVGALPEPELINSLLNIKGNPRKEPVDEEPAS